MGLLFMTLSTEGVSLKKRLWSPVFFVAVLEVAINLFRGFSIYPILLHRRRYDTIV